MNLVLVWAWWTGMSWVAWILDNLWYWESLICLDSTESELTKKLEAKWIKVIIWNSKYIPTISDHIIYSEACTNSSEVLHAKSFKRKPKEQRFIWNYFDFLWEISKYFTTVWITWTNWKSTTTSLAIYTAKTHLQNFGLWILWALVPELDNNNYYINQDKKSEIKNILDYIFTGKWLNYSLIKKNIFILEACEYKRHFLKLDIDRWIITNIELDHTDYYKDLNDYTLAFQQFTQKTKNKVITTNLSLRDEWNESWQSIKHKLVNTTIKNFNFTHLFWQHNNQNWTLVFELIKQLNPSVDETKLTDTIQNFKWLRRRLELIQTTKNGALVFSDYGHMASSIKFCYDAIHQKYPDKKITAIFQPHQTDRIIREWEQFQNALKPFQQKIIFDIYAAREDLPKQFKKFEEKTQIKVQNIEELGQIFAKFCNGNYTTDIQNILKIINIAKNDEIIIFFSAWDLDFLIRKSI